MTKDKVLPVQNRKTKYWAIPRVLRTCFVQRAVWKHLQIVVHGHLRQCLAHFGAFSAHSYLANGQESAAKHLVVGSAARIVLKASVWKKGDCNLLPFPAYSSCCADGKPCSGWGSLSPSSPDQQCQELILAALKIACSYVLLSQPRVLCVSLLTAEVQPFWGKRRQLPNSMPHVTKENVLKAICSGYTTHSSVQSTGVTSEIVLRASSHCS